MENMKLKLGYRKIFLNGQEYRGHEFHYSRIIPGQSPLPSIARVTNAKGWKSIRRFIVPGMSLPAIFTFIGEIFPRSLFDKHA